MKQDKGLEEILVAPVHSSIIKELECGHSPSVFSLTNNKQNGVIRAVRIISLITKGIPTHAGRSMGESQGH